MIRAIELENFKGVQSRQRIELAPVTLLFGANSAGKSTILHALLLVREVLAHGNADVDRTSLGGDSVNLGGFSQYVHAHDASKKVSIRIEFDVKGSLDTNRLIPDSDFIFPDLDDDVTRAWVELTIGPSFEPGEIEYRSLSLSVGINEWRPAFFECFVENAGRAGECIRVQPNIEHEYVRQSGQDDALRDLSHAAGEYPPEDTTFRISGRGLRDAIPDFLQPIQIFQATELTPEAAELEVLLSVVLGGILRRLKTMLDALLYVGPLRMVPPRGFLAERTHVPGKWASGLGAWDALSRDQSLVERVNESLAAIGAEHQLVFQVLSVKSNATPWVSKKEYAQAMAIPDEYADDAWHGEDERELRLRLLDEHGHVLGFHDVGVGLSQVIPVLTACHFPGDLGPIVVEQPELHIHPRVQVGLGDLLLRTSRQRQVIAETHSEHIILRLLRRIRETAEGELPEGAPSCSNEDVSILYVTAAKEGATTRRLRIDAHGEFLDRWPNGFFEERAEELF